MTDNFSLLNQVRTVVSTLQDRLFEAYYFKRSQCLVETTLVVFHCLIFGEYWPF